MNQNINKTFSMLGLAMKAGKLVSGEFATEKAIKDGKARLVVIASDASPNTNKLFDNRCNYYNVPLVIFGTKSELGHILGKEVRASLAIIDANFGREILKQIEKQNNMEV